MKVKSGDNVVVISGKDKKKSGKIMRVMKKRNLVVVKGINMRKKHIRKSKTRPGEIITFEAPVNASNVKILCPSCSKAVRVGYIILETGKKQRICKKCKQAVDREEQTKSAKK